MNSAGTHCLDPACWQPTWTFSIRTSQRLLPVEDLLLQSKNTVIGRSEHANAEKATATVTRQSAVQVWQLRSKQLLQLGACSTTAHSQLADLRSLCAAEQRPPRMSVVAA